MINAWPVLPALRLLAAGAVMAVVVGLVCEDVVSRSARGRCTRVLDELPHRRVGLVLGTRPSRSNPHYAARIEAAARLFAFGKVDRLLVSGDNGRIGYDEPTRMRDDLVRLGVPVACIYRDFAGFRTLDSVIRAKAVFGLDEAIVVSQRFHNERAVYLAARAGIDLIGYDATDAASPHAMRVAIRERFARVAAVIDADVLGTEPRFRGPLIAIGTAPAN